MQFIRIPEERVRVLIGEGGSAKKEIEKRTKCKIEVSDGEVSVDGEGMDEWVAKDVVHAVGRGFSPDRALYLLQDGYAFDLVDLSDFAKTSASLGRLRGRLIGEEGRTRKFIERTSQVMMSVYGKTAAFIGPFDGVAMAKEAVGMLLGGSRHASVYKFLEKKRGKAQ
jgi:ribosomal RNA assembly protein